MKNKIIIALMCLGLSIGLTSCSENEIYTRDTDNILMVGNKGFKLRTLTINGIYIHVLVPADSSVSIIPGNITHSSGKTTTTTFIVQ